MKFKEKILNGKVLSGRVYPEFFVINNSERVLNIGCGDGPQAVVYAGKYREMVGVDINCLRLESSKKLIEDLGIKNYSTICANVESIPLPDKSFNKAIAIDIIEHVNSPEKICREAYRLIKDNGKLLITFPTMHDKYTKVFSLIGRYVLRRKHQDKTDKSWDPDKHNHDYPIRKWISLVSNCGFKLEKSRATTMFPPLHLYGVPRFWFYNDFIHFIDSLICVLPWIKNYGQSLVCAFQKK